MGGPFYIAVLDLKGRFIRMDIQREYILQHNQVLVPVHLGPYIDPGGMAIQVNSLGNG